MTITKKEILESFVSRLQQILDNGQIPPWQKPWTPQFGPEGSRPHNPLTGNPYKGLNSLDLELNAALAGYVDPRWMGFKQAAEQGWHVRKGEKATHIHLPVEVILNQDGIDFNGGESGRDKPSRRILLFKRVPVFNAQQIEGIPPLALVPESELLPKTQALDVMAQQMGVRITEVAGDRAFYLNGPDVITLPLRAAFADQYGHDSTLAHELAHATGHASRLKRDLGGAFGSFRYSAEEVTAEIGAYLACKELGVPYSGGNPDMSDEQHLAYTASWATNLKANPATLALAIDNGIRASRYLSQQLDLHRITEINLSQDMPSEIMAHSEPGPGPKENSRTPSAISILPPLVQRPGGPELNDGLPDFQRG